MLPQPHRLHAKLFFDAPIEADLTVFVSVFHRWIQRQAVETLLIDVHNYAHIDNGPGILLVGHEGDYAVDESGGRVGLLYRMKRQPAASLAGAVALAIRRLAAGAVLLENDRSLSDLLLARTELELTIVDRLAYPNTPDTFGRIRDCVIEVVRVVTAAADATVEHVDNDPREPLTVRLTFPGGVTYATLAASSAVVEAEA